MATNDEILRDVQELKTITIKQGGEANNRLLSIETHLATLNGKVAAHEERFSSLPCEEHGDILTRTATLVEASLSPREMGRLEATVGAQPTAREVGRMEERQEVHKSNWKRAWEIVKLPLFAVIGALIALVVAGAVP
jgi:hypothetical protein